MKKRFKSKRSKKKHIFVYIIIILIILLLDIIYINKQSADNIVNQYIPNIFDIKIDPKEIFLYLSLNHYMDNNSSDNEDISVFKEYDFKSPTIYVYNTHQKEEYKDYDVLKAANYMKSELKKYDIDTIVEQTDIEGVVKKNNWAYKDSYKVTRNLLEKRINDNISLYIDLHRDSSSYNVSTVKIAEKSYARILFVVGGKHETFNNNYLIAEHLNKILKNINKDISRGIFVRKSSSYNQDLNSNVILIEIGGPNNSKDEVNRSIEVFAEVIAQFIGE